MDSKLLDYEIERKADLLFCEVDQEIVLLDMQAGHYLGLNVVASRIFELLATPQTLNSICEQLMTEYEIDAISCKNEVSHFIQELHEKNIIYLRSK